MTEGSNVCGCFTLECAVLTSSNPTTEHRYFNSRKSNCNHWRHNSPIIELNPNQFLPNRFRQWSAFILWVIQFSWSVTHLSFSSCWYQLIYISKAESTNWPLLQAAIVDNFRLNGTDSDISLNRFWLVGLQSLSQLHAAVVDKLSRLRHLGGGITTLQAHSRRYLCSLHHHGDHQHCHHLISHHTPQWFRPLHSWVLEPQQWQLDCCYRALGVQGEPGGRLNWIKSGIELVNSVFTSAGERSGMSASEQLRFSWLEYGVLVTCNHNIDIANLYSIVNLSTSL